ncbi:MAG: PaaI family thioesterase [Candidatus Abyssobacteria bacterium SURF_5]|uniref:PaaI family thioesterase n=1 Tax=Abyssobacteria bacterium (strain SURF_5) TaxID=2093360 RepID=A0A3A4N465_ABYX5|nr:MAG: PaaI family thioesterase [Candidatus Abyssubacteria bacterium SURF_5]
MAIASVSGIERTGLKILELRDRYAKALMPLEGNTNHVGIMYAGSLFTLGEFAGGAIHLVSMDFSKFFPIVKEVRIRFRRPATTDVTMEVTMSEQEAIRLQAEAEKIGKADYELSLQLKDENGESVAEVAGVWQIRKIPEGMEPPNEIAGRNRRSRGLHLV